MARGRVYNNFYNDEDWSLVNKENIAIMEDFLLEYKQRKMKKSTLAQYHNNLRIILIYVLKFCDNKSLLDLNKKHFRNLSIWLSDDKELSSARVNQMMSTIRSLLTYVENQEEYDLDINYAKKVKGLPKEAVKTNEDDFFLTYEQVAKLRNALIEKGDLQGACMLMVFFDTGARRNEVQQILKHNADKSNKTNVVVGKRGKKFPLIYLDDTKELIGQYLEKRGEDNINSLWISGSGENKKEASYETLYDRIVAMSDLLAKLENTHVAFFPHSLRHSRCECLLQGLDPRLLDKDGNKRKYTLEELQVFLHHTETNTTKGYAKNHDEDVLDLMFTQ